MGRSHTDDTPNQSSTRTNGLGHGPRMIVQRSLNRGRQGARDGEKGQYKASEKRQQQETGISKNRFAHLMPDDVRDVQQSGQVLENVGSQLNDMALMRTTHINRKKQKGDKGEKGIQHTAPSNSPLHITKKLL